MSMMKLPLVALSSCLASVWFLIGREQRIVEEQTRTTVAMVEADRRIMGDRLNMTKQKLETAMLRVRELELALGETPTMPDEEHEQILQQHLEEVEESLATTEATTTEGDAVALLLQSLCELQSLSQDLWLFFASQLISSLWPLDVPEAAAPTAGAAGGSAPKRDQAQVTLAVKIASALTSAKEALRYPVRQVRSAGFFLWSKLNDNMKASLQALYASGCDHVEAAQLLAVATWKRIDASLHTCMQGFAAHSPTHRPTISGHSPLVVLAAVHLYLFVEGLVAAACLGAAWRLAKACCSRRNKRRATSKDALMMKQFKKGAAARGEQQLPGRMGGA